MHITIYILIYHNYIVLKAIVTWGSPISRSPYFQQQLIHPSTNGL